MVRGAQKAEGATKLGEQVEERMGGEDGRKVRRKGSKEKVGRNGIRAEARRERQRGLKGGIGRRHASGE